MSSANYFGGPRRRELIRELAEGVLTTDQLAAKYGKPRRFIIEFAGRHREHIFALRQDPTDEIGALWISRLADRLEELQTDVEHINSLLEEGRGGSPARLLEVKHSALRHAAESLGQLQHKLYGEGTLGQIEVRIVGVDPEIFHDPADPSLAMGRGFDDEQP